MNLFPSSEIGRFGRRQRHVRGHRIPVTIMRSAENVATDSVVVVDSFGADDIMPLPGGCPCCTVRKGLQTALRALLAEREKKPFNRVVIESEQDMGAILRTFVSGNALGAEFYVEDVTRETFDAEESGICRFVLTDTVPISWRAFCGLVGALTGLRGADLLHANGRLQIQGCKGPVVIELMQHLTHHPVELQAWPSDDRSSRLEFVTRDIEEAIIRELFASVRALS